MYDLWFHYKYVGRYILLLKNSKIYYNSSLLLKLNSVNVFFDIKDIEDIDNLSISNCFFFFKFFFGRKGYYINYDSYFELNVYYYNFIVKCDIKDKNMYFVLWFFLNDIYIYIGLKSVYRIEASNHWDFEINDMYFFSEKYKKIGFFNLKHTVTFSFYFNNFFIFDDSMLFTLFKI